MKNAMRLIMAGMLCMMLAAQEPENQEPEQEEVEDYLEKCDANENGTITCAEARACGLETPITKDHTAYQYMNDRDGDGQVCE